ncbi:unnamed protein product [Diabrotica balteata]|uniref:Endonuclease-reverse transcriptase n=1 Tax=Diabrotica balteata TaxID=107213 RepID=A0A9N9STZ0_DIABA|nr:unnamed protein product [Diabrotica balteata]
MYINRQKRRDRIGQNVTIDPYNFKRVESFKYLGATITTDNDITEEIKGRIQAANRCMYSLHNTIKSKSLTRTSKIRVYKTVIRPVLMYGCETWTLTKAMESKLRCFEKKSSE